LKQKIKKLDAKIIFRRKRREICIEKTLKTFFSPQAAKKLKTISEKLKRFGSCQSLFCGQPALPLLPCPSVRSPPTGPIGSTPNTLYNPS